MEHMHVCKHKSTLMYEELFAKDMTPLDIGMHNDSHLF